MSKVSIRKRRNPALRAFKQVLCCFIGIVLAIGIYSAIDSDGYLFLLQQNTEVGSLFSKITSVLQTTFGITSNSSASAAGQEGFNTLLIAKMSNGYAKDYLNICLENQEGKLDNTKRKVTVQIEAIIGVNVSETQCYSIKDHQVTLPTSDIPVSYITNGKYGTGDISLYKWNAKSSPHGTGPGGAFAYISGTKLTGINTTSHYNTGTSTPNGKGDAYLMPDAVCGLNDFLATGLKELNVDSKTLKSSEYYSDITGACAGFEHNSGSGLLKALYGVMHYANGYKINGSDKETMERLETLIADMHNGVNTLSAKDKKALFSSWSNPRTWIAADICMTTQGWYLSEEMIKNICGHTSDAITVWNYFYPDKKVNSASELKNALNKYKMSVSELTGYSVSECNKVYATTEGSYSEGIRSYHKDYTSQIGYGTIMKLLPGTTDALNKKGVKRVIAIPGIPLQHMFAIVAVGRYIANRMLIYGGVPADLVNSSSTNTSSASAEENSVSVNNTNLNASGKTLSLFKSKGVDIKKLNQGRYAVLAAAAKMDGKTYVFGASHDSTTCSNLDHYAYDCSSFVEHAIAASGLKGIKKAMAGFPGATYEYKTKDSGILLYHDMNLNDLLPGDILHRYGGHVMFYCGKKSGRFVTLEAMNSKNGCGWKTRGSISNFPHRYTLKGYY